MSGTSEPSEGGKRTSGASEDSEDSESGKGGDQSREVELTLVTMRFRASDAASLAAILSHYVVVTRRSPGCRNIDLCVSVADPRVFVVIQKWDSPDAQQAHFDSEEMVAMAQSCNGLLLDAPQIDLLEGISAHDLK